MTHDKIRILVVDDDLQEPEGAAKGFVYEHARDSLVKPLVDAGYRIDTTYNLDLAREKLKENFYHLLITDLGFPDSSRGDKGGLELFREVREKYCQDGLPVIVVTNKQPDAMKIAFLRYGAANFLIKDGSDMRAENYLAAITDALTGRSYRPVIKSIGNELEIRFNGGTTFTSMAQRIMRPSASNAGRLEDELESLFQRLFDDKKKIVIEALSSGFGPSGVVKVLAEDAGGATSPVIVKYGAHETIDQEYKNWKNHVQFSVGDHATYVHGLQCTPLLGGVMYSFVGVGDSTIDFASFYRDKPLKDIDDVLENLFGKTIGNWFKRRGNTGLHSFVDVYARDTFGMNRVQLETAMDKYFQGVGTQKQISLSEWGIDQMIVPNPIPGVFEGKFAKNEEMFAEVTTHGDLNEHNILIDQSKPECWLIDFYRTGRGHILRDFVKLETSIKLNLIDTTSLKARYELEKALLDDRVRVAPRFSDSSLEKAFSVCRKIRELARLHIQNNDEFSKHYRVGLMFNNLAALRYEGFDDFRRKHALMAAGMLYKKLGS